MPSQPYWVKRNIRAQALGYRNYYDYRAHDHGRIPPSRPPLRGPELARLRGHRSAADLIILLKRKRVEMIGVVATVDERGRPRVDALATLSNGRTLEFHLNERALQKVRATVDEQDPEAVLLVGSPAAVRQFIGRRRRRWRYKTKP